MPVPSPHGELTATNRSRLQQLRSKARSDSTFAALVDMYRNVSWEPEVAAHWMALHDYDTYVRMGVFTPLLAGYSDAEMRFLSKRGVSML